LAPHSGRHCMSWRDMRTISCALPGNCPHGGRLAADMFTKASASRALFAPRIGAAPCTYTTQPDIRPQLTLPVPYHWPGGGGQNTPCERQRKSTTPSLIHWRPLPVLPGPHGYSGGGLQPPLRTHLTQLTTCVALDGGYSGLQYLHCVYTA